MIREGVLRWFHFRLCGWVGDHAPAGLVFQCVLRTYDRCYRESIGGSESVTAETLLNESGRWADEAWRKARTQSGVER